VEVFIAGTSAWAAGCCGGSLGLFWVLPLLDGALWKFVVGWLFGLFQGPELRLLEMSLQPEALFRASFRVVFHGCSFEHTNGGCQCWGSIAGGYRTPAGKGKGA
jgi:hypothetical protein